MKKSLFGLLAACAIATAMAGTLPAPKAPFVLSPAVDGVSTASAPFAPGVAVTGFSADGNYILGQIPSQFGVGCPGRGCIRHYQVCTYVQWDLAGNLVSTVTPTNGLANLPCPSVTLNQPSNTPPSNSVVGNEFENAGGYIAETIVEQICGSLACPASWIYYVPTLISP